MRRITSISQRRAQTYAFIGAVVLLVTTVIMVSIREKEEPPLSKPDPNPNIITSSQFYRYIPIVDVPPVTDDDEETVEELIEPIEPEVAPVVEEELVEETKYNVPLDEELQNYIEELCEQFNIPIELVYAIISVESDFRSNLISKTNDYGLMQINEINHEWLSEQHGISDFLNPYQNVYCGILIFASHYERYNDIIKALMAYNMGANGAAKAWAKGIYSTYYTDKIEKALKELQQNYK